VVSTVELIEDLLGSYMKNPSIDLNFLNSFFKSLKKKLPDSVSMRIMQNFLLRHVQTSDTEEQSSSEEFTKLSHSKHKPSKLRKSILMEKKSQSALTS
jgi:hypothetical protein